MLFSVLAVKSKSIIELNSQRKKSGQFRSLLRGLQAEQRKERLEHLNDGDMGGTGRKLRKISTDKTTRKLNNYNGKCTFCHSMYVKFFRTCKNVQSCRK